MSKLISQSENPERRLRVYPEIRQKPEVAEVVEEAIMKMGVYSGVCVVVAPVTGLAAC